MKWRSIQLLRAPGVADGLGVSACGAGLNLVIGPNGIGKSTLSRAASAVLWDEVSCESMHVAACFEFGDGAWDVTREGQRPAQWHSAKGERPNLPEARFRDCFYLGLEDLMRLGETEQEITRKLRLEMSGQYDLEPVGKEARRHEASKAYNARNLLNDAKIKVASLEEQARELLVSEESIKGREIALKEERQKGANRPALEALQARLRDQAQLAELEYQLADDDPRLTRFGFAAEFQELKKLENQHARADDEAQKAREEEHKASLDLGELALPADGVDNERLELATAQATTLKNLEQTLPLKQSELRRLKGQSEDGAVLPIGNSWASAEIDAAQSLLTRIAENRKRRKALETVLRQTAIEEQAPKRDPWHKVESLLERSLSPGGAGSFAAPLMALLALAAAAITIFMVLAGAGREVAPSWWGLPILALVAALLAAYRIRSSAGAAPGSSLSSKPCRELQELLEESAKFGLADQLRSFAKVKRVELKQNEDEARELEEQASGLRRRLGVEAGQELQGQQLLAALGHAAEFRGAREEFEGFEADCEKQYQDLEDSLEALGAGRAGSPDLAVIRLEQFSSRARNFEPLSTALAKSRERLAGCRARLDEARAGRQEFLDSHNLAADQTGSTLALEPRFAEHFKRREEARRLERSVANIEESWKARPELLELDESSLAARLADAEASDQRAAELQKELSRIEWEVEAQGTDTKLLEAELKQREARDQLEDARGRALAGEATRALISELKRLHRRHGRPEVLRRAGEHFGEFTKDKYDLENFDGEDLLVLEIASKRRLTPGQLSSGTRTQLMIALRLAYAETIETGEPLPFFLDEALLTSDPVRFAAITACVGKLIEGGRQVFYFTAEPREEEEWIRALAGSEVQPVVHDLGREREKLRALAGDSLELTPLTAVPPPGDLSFVEYAALLGGLPRLDGFAPGGALHILYLYSDRLEEAHAMLETRHSSVGAVGAFLGRSDFTPWDEPQRARFKARVEVAESALSLWRRGRAPRLTEEQLLETSMARKSSKMDEVIALAHGCDMDAKALMAALDARAVSHMRENMIELLRSELDGAGCLPGEEPLSGQDLVKDCQAALEGSISQGRITREEVIQLAHQIYLWLTPEPSASEVSEEPSS